MVKTHMAIYRHSESLSLGKRLPLSHEHSMKKVKKLAMSKSAWVSPTSGSLEQPYETRRFIHATSSRQTICSSEVSHHHFND